MARVLVIAFASQLPGEKGNNRSRFRTICEMFTARGHSVTEIVSSFRDYDKKQRCLTDSYQATYEIAVLPEWGYKRNISIRRIISQATFAHSVQRWLRGHFDFDLIYCCVPTFESAAVAGRFAKKSRIPLVIDIQDLWPEAMQTVVRSNLLHKILFAPMRWQADAVYRSADAIVACSDTYLERALSANPLCKRAESVYIGCDLDRFDESTRELPAVIEKGDQEIWVTYIGMLGVSYDLDTLIMSCDRLYREGMQSLRVLLIGDGERMGELQDLAKSCQVPVRFTGWLDFSVAAGYLVRSDVLVNALKTRAAQSITNKISDYVAAGVPIVNGSTNEEFRNLVAEWQIGLNFQAENVDSLAAAIRTLIIGRTPEERAQMGRNARKLAEELFDRKTSYQRIVALVDEMLAIDKVNPA